MSDQDASRGTQRQRSESHRVGGTAVDDHSNSAPVPEPVRTAVDEAAAKARAATAVSRRAAARASVPLRVAKRRARIFMWIALGALAAFSGLAIVVHGHQQNSVDLRITKLIQRQQRRHASITWLMSAISAPGYAPWPWLIPATCAGLFRWLNYRLEAIFMLGTMIAGAIVAGIKIVIARPRPSHPEIFVKAPLKDYSFPSGHTIQYAAQFGYLCYLAYTLLRPGRLRRAVLTALGPLILLIAPARIGLGQHWASDVLASYCLGTSFLIAHIGLYRRLKARQKPVGRATSMTVPPSEAPPPDLAAATRGAPPSPKA